MEPKTPNDIQEFLAPLQGGANTTALKEVSDPLVYSPETGLGELTNYDTGLTPYLDKQENRANNQEWGQTMLNGISQLISGTIGEIVSTPGYIGGMFEPIEEMDKGISGLFLDAGKAISEWGQEFAPIHQSQASREKVFAPWDSEWMAQTVADFGPTVALMATAVATEGMATPAMLRMMSKVPGLSKYAKAAATLKNNSTFYKGLRASNSALLSRTAESGMEAYQTFEENYAKLQRENPEMSDEEMRRLAGEAGAEVWRKNWGLIALDFIQYHGLLNGFGKFGKLPTLAIESGTEALEEGIQFAFQQEAKEDLDFKLGKTGQDLNTIETFFQNLGNTEMQKAMVQGALGGAVFQGAGILVDKITDKYRQPALNSIAGVIKQAHERGDLSALKKDIDTKLSDSEINPDQKEYLEGVSKAINTFEAAVESGNSPEVAQSYTKADQHSREANKFNEKIKTVTSSDVAGENTSKATLFVEATVAPTFIDDLKAKYSDNTKAMKILKDLENKYKQQEKDNTYDGVTDDAVKVAPLVQKHIKAKVENEFLKELNLVIGEEASKGKTTTKDNLLKDVQVDLIKQETNIDKLFQLRDSENVELSKAAKNRLNQLYKAEDKNIPTTIDELVPFYKNNPLTFRKDLKLYNLPETTTLQEFEEIAKTPEFIESFNSKQKSKQQDEAVKAKEEEIKEIVEPVAEDTKIKKVESISKTTEKTEKTEIESKKADIEKRRQEELNNVNGQAIVDDSAKFQKRYADTISFNEDGTKVETFSKNKAIALLNEMFTEYGLPVKNITHTKGFKLGITLTDGHVITFGSILSGAIGQSLAKEQRVDSIPGLVAEILNHDSKIAAQFIASRINAKYDAELAALETQEKETELPITPTEEFGINEEPTYIDIEGKNETSTDELDLKEEQELTNPPNRIKTTDAYFYTYNEEKDTFSIPSKREWNISAEKFDSKYQKGKRKKGYHVLYDKKGQVIFFPKEQEPTLDIDFLRNLSQAGNVYSLPVTLEVDKNYTSGNGDWSNSKPLSETNGWKSLKIAVKIKGRTIGFLSAAEKVDGDPLEVAQFEQLRKSIWENTKNSATDVYTYPVTTNISKFNSPRFWQGPRTKDLLSLQQTDSNGKKLPIILGIAKNGKLFLNNAPLSDTQKEELEGKYNLSDGSVYWLLTNPVTGDYVPYRLFTTKIANAPKAQAKLRELFGSITEQNHKEVLKKVRAIVRWKNNGKYEPDFGYTKAGKFFVVKDGEFNYDITPDQVYDYYVNERGYNIIDDSPLQVEAEKLNQGTYNEAIIKAGYFEANLNAGLFHSPNFKIDISKLVQEKKAPVVKKTIPFMVDKFSLKKKNVKVTKWDEKKETQWFKEKIGDTIDLNVVDEGEMKEILNSIKHIHNMDNVEAWGFFHNASVWISKNAKSGTTQHEAFHVIFNLALTPKQQNALLDWGAKEYGIDRNKKADNELMFSLAQNVKEAQIEYTLKIIDGLNKIQRNKFDKSKLQGWLNDLRKQGVSAQQLKIFQEYAKDGMTKEEIIASINANLSFVVESNIAKGESVVKNDFNPEETPNQTFELNGNIYFAKRLSWTEIEFTKNNKVISEQEYSNAFSQVNQNNAVPTSYYSNLTVPGGTNYTENEIRTPQIIPSIKGHAQFSTDEGIGWFRSDEVSGEIDESTVEYEEGPFGEEIPVSYRNKLGTKTRRILELQSDLFQQGRDRITLTKEGRGIEHHAGYGFQIGNLYYKYSSGMPEGQKYSVVDVNTNIRKTISKKEFETKRFEGIDITDNENQFLQILNKDNAWVTFFIKSIVQDSQKKGYEKVLFPKGETAAKIEGHQTLEEFKEQKENRIKYLKEKDIVAYLQKQSFPDSQGNYWAYNFIDGGNYSFKTLEEAKEAVTKNNIKAKEVRDKEIKTLKKEIADVESGQTQLSSIAKFYEETVTNILKKQYGKNNVAVITDEYGNEWVEVDLTSMPKETILLSTASEEYYKQLSGDAQIEEELADLFAEYVQKAQVNEELLKKSSWYKRLGATVKRLFRKMYMAMKAAVGMNLSQEEIFFNIQSGAYRNNKGFKRNVEAFKPSLKAYPDNLKQQDRLSQVQRWFNEMYLEFKDIKQKEGLTEQKILDMAIKPTLDGTLNTDNIYYRLSEMFRTTAKEWTEAGRVVEGQEYEELANKLYDGSIENIKDRFGPMYYNALDSLKDYGIRVSRLQGDLDINDETQDSLENWMEAKPPAAYESISKQIKMGLAALPRGEFDGDTFVPERDDLYFPRFVNPFEVYSYMKDNLGGALSVEDWMEDLNKMGEEISWAKILHQILSGARQSTIITDIELFKAQLHQFLQEPKPTFKYLLQQVEDKKKGLYEWRFNNSASKSIATRLATKWIGNIGSPLYNKVVKDGKLEEVSKGLNEYIEKNKNDNTWLFRTMNDLGIIISKEAIEAVTKVGANKRDFLNNLKVVVDNVDKKNFGELMFVRNSLVALAKLVKRYYPEFHLPAFTNVEGETVQNYIRNSFMARQINKLKSAKHRQSTIDKYRQDKFYGENDRIKKEDVGGIEVELRDDSYSLWLDRLQHNRAYEKLEFAVLDGQKMAGQNVGKAYADLSPLEFNRMTLNAFYNNGNYKSGNDAGKSFYSAQIMADSGSHAYIGFESYSQGDIINKLVLMAKNEYYAYLDNLIFANQTGIKGYNPKLMFIPGLIENKNNLTLQEIQEKAIALVQNEERLRLAIKTNLDKIAEETLDEGVKENLIISEQGEYSSPHLDYRIKDIPEFIKDFVYNDFFAQTQIISLFHGKLYQYKSMEDFYKRAKEIWSPGNFIDTSREGVNQKFMTYIVDSGSTVLNYENNKEVIDAIYNNIIKAGFSEDDAKKAASGYGYTDGTLVRPEIDKIHHKIAMNFEDGTGGRKMRAENKGKSTLQLIKEGKRTATSRDRSKSYNQQDIKVGDIIEFYANQGQSKGETVLVQVTSTPYKLNTISAEKWSELEGWSADRFSTLKDQGYEQFTFKLIEKPAVTLSNGAVILSDYVDATDAQGIIDIHRWREIMLGKGMEKVEVERIYEAIINDTYTIDDLTMVMNPIKQFYYTLINVNGQVSGIQIKNSEFVLLPQIAKGNPKLEGILKFLDDSRKKHGVNASINFDSAVKVGIHKVNKSIEELSVDNAIELDNNEYRIQGEVPEHQVDTTNLLGTQLRKLIVGDLNWDDVYEIGDFKDKLTGKELIEEWNQLLIADIEASSAKLNDEFGEDVKFYKMLQDEARSRDYPDKYIEALTLVDGKPRMSLFSPLLTNKSQALIGSTYRNNITKMKFNGMTSPNAMSYGLSKELKILYNADGSIKAFETYLPLWSKSLVENMEEVTVKELEKLELDLGVAYRIPTEGKYSMIPLKIKGFTNAGIMLPHLITKISGLDYDIDKMFVMLYEFVIRNNKPVKVDFYSNPSYKSYVEGIKFSKAARELPDVDNIEELLIEKDLMMTEAEWNKMSPYARNTQKARDNRKLDIIRAVLNNPKTIKSQLTPGGFDDLKAEANRIEKKKGLNLGKINPMTLLSRTKIFSRMMAGKKLIGIPANYNATHALMQHNNLELTRPVLFDGEQGKDLGLLYTLTDKLKLVSNNFAQYLASVVDNGKDPLADKYNLNTYTADVAMLLAKFYPIELGMKFIAQPSIVEFYKEYVNAGGNFKAEEVAILKVLGMSKRDYNKQMENFVLENINSSELEAGLTESPRSSFQTKVLLHFLHYKNNQAKDLGKLVSAIKVPDAGTSSSIAKTVNNIAKVNDALKLESIIGIKGFLNNENLANNSLYEKGVIDAMRKFIDLGFPDYINPESAFVSIQDKFADLKGMILGEKEINLINEASYSFLSSGFDPLKSIDTLKLMKEAPKLWKEFIAKNNKEYYALMGSIDAVASDHDDSRDKLVLNNNQPKDIENQVINEWENLMASPKPINSQYTEADLGKMLTEYAFVTNGFRFTTGSLSHIQPITYYENLTDGVTDYNTFIAQQIQAANNNKNYLDHFYDQFIRHYFPRLSYVKSYEKEELTIRFDEKTKEPYGAVLNDFQAKEYVKYRDPDSKKWYLFRLESQKEDGTAYYERINPLGLYREIEEWNFDITPKNSIFEQNNMSVELEQSSEKFVEVNVKSTDELTQESGVELTSTKNKTYSGKITKLQPNQIFVFGSNPEGRHGKGSAATAVSFGLKKLREYRNENNFGIITKDLAGYVSKDKFQQDRDGNTFYFGLDGNQYYADKVVINSNETGDLIKEIQKETDKNMITTVKGEDWNQQIPRELIIEGIQELYKEASQNPSKEYLVAYSSERSNLNGYTAQDLANMFSALPIPNNIVFEEGFSKLLKPLTTELTQDQVDQNINTMSEFINHSGGAKGGDTVWDNVGREFGVDNHNHYRPSDYENAINKKELDVQYLEAVKFLGRGTIASNTYAGKLVRRDMIQANKSDAIFGITELIAPKVKGRKGYVNKKSHIIPEGGTGYAVARGILSGKDVYVYNQSSNYGVKQGWYKWVNNNFVKTETPILTKNFAGIGSQEINESGKQAIREVYKNTQKSLPIRQESFKKADITQPRQGQQLDLFDQFKNNFKTTDC